MSDQTDLFDKEKEQTTTEEVVTTETKVEEAPSTEQRANETYNEYLARIRNEEGTQKYATVEDALTGAAHAQEFISTLKTEKSSLEEELNKTKQELEKRMSVEDAMERLASRKDEIQTSNPGLTREDVQAILRAEEQEKTAKANRAEVSQALEKVYGDQDKASKALEEKSKELGLSLQDVAALAAKSPKSTMKLLGLEESLRTKPSSEGSLNSEALAHQSAQNQEPEKIGLQRFSNSQKDAEMARKAREAVLKRLENS